MGNWLSIEGLERGTRNSFLINRKPTDTEIHRLRGLFTQIEQATTTIKTLLRRFQSSGSKSDIKRQIEEKTVHLLYVYESLKEMVRSSEGLRDRFIFDMERIERNTRTSLKRYAYLSDEF